MSVFLLILGLVLFLGLVVVHELGHFLVARRNGVEVEEFGIGFPPRLWGRKTKRGYDFTINLLPLGGFVKLKGESDSAKEPGTLGAASTFAKTKILLAGVGMNLLVAFVMLTGLALIGMPQLIPNQFTVNSDTKIVRTNVLTGYIETGSPAKKAGLRSTDKLVSITAQGKTYQVRKAADLPPITKKYAGQEITIHYLREGNSRTAGVKLLTQSVVAASKHTKTQKGYLGIGPTDFKISRSTWSAPIVALGLIKQITILTFQAIGGAIVAAFQGQGHKATENLSGPVGIVILLKSGSLLGYQFVLMIIAIISLSLAIMNVLPVPALDGGRLYMILLSRVFKKQLSQEMEERIVGASFLFLLFLVILISFVDVKRFL